MSYSDSTMMMMMVMITMMMVIIMMTTKSTAVTWQSQAISLDAQSSCIA